MSLITPEIKIANIKEQEQSVLVNINTSNEKLSNLLRDLENSEIKYNDLQTEIDHKQEILNLINTQIISRNDIRIEKDKRLFSLNEEIDKKSIEADKVFEEALYKIKSYKGSLEYEIKSAEERRENLRSEIDLIEKELSNKSKDLNEYRLFMGESVKDITTKQDLIVKEIEVKQKELNDINKKISESNINLENILQSIEDGVNRNSKVYEYLEKRELELDRRERDVRVIEERQERMKQMGGINFLRKQK